MDVVRGCTARAVVLAAAVAAACLALTGGSALAGSADPGSAFSGSPAPPNPVDLLRVSCPVTSFCMAVGSTGVGGGWSPLSQRWNGKAWRTLAVPAPPDSYLGAVSCPSSASCLAAGVEYNVGPIFEEWNGKTWRMLPPPAVLVNALACTGAARCIAVGTEFTATASRAVAEMWNGTGWHELATADPPGSASTSFSDISCANATMCMATGQLVTSTGDHALAESWNGSTWTQLTTPASSAGFGAVSCASATACMTAGPVRVIGQQAAVWNGTAWTTLTLPSQGGSILAPSGISCPSAARCIAVGSGDRSPLAMDWTGGRSWKLMAMPRPDQPFLSAISCPAPSSCMAVGGGDNPTDPSSLISLIMHWNGSTWRVIRTGQSDNLPDVSCARMSRCLAVGTYLNFSDNARVMVQAWNGRTWRLTSPRAPADSLASTSCAGPSFCMAVGGSMAATWNGSRWTSVNPHAISGGGFGSLSCTSRAFCMALGGQSGSEVWNGRSWRAAPTLTPPGSTGSSLSDVSCTGPAYCMAVGAYNIDEYDQVNYTLAEVWKGTRWRMLPTPNPGQDNIFASVSCVIRAGCMAVAANFAARWNGTSWQVRPMPGSFASGSVDVSCPTLASCMAVGNYYNPGNGLHYDQAAVWNGKTWRLTSTAGPGGGLADVSCTAAGRCIAVGQAGTLTLAERWNGKTWKQLKTLNP